MALSLGWMVGGLCLSFLLDFACARDGYDTPEDLPRPTREEEELSHHGTWLWAEKTATSAIQ
jgi:hypothetical protein